jgi:hypothetical protein
MRIALGVALVGFAAWVMLGATAFASNHLIKIREVYPGEVAQTADEYVDLQMYSPGQNFFSAGTVTKLYNATGTVTATFSTPGDNSNNPPNSASQDYVLLATQSAQTDFGINAGYTLPAGNNLSPAGGAVCYIPTQSTNADCVSWGNFTGSLPSSTGGNVDSTGSGIPDTFALRRSISPGCPTLLESGDDTNAPGDWANVVPAPHNNAFAPTETPCANTTITKKPKAKTTDRTPTFKFTSSVNPATFECKLDGAPFTDCSSPFTSKKLSRGKHTFRVRATANGSTDPTPASAKFKIIRKHHH